ncbi:MAG: GTPase Era [Proteobacteria bacterium]|nr:GTPase Era [Pseudomonadota bacterium]MBQ9244315.1 GTPase Era [Pseudomonadota bacterium]
MPKFRCGFVALVGRTNAGKSTLVNALTGERVSITSSKAQTTRDKIRGIVNRRTAQVVFIDTPGLHLWLKRTLNQVMIQSALSTLGDADCVLMLIDATHALTSHGEIEEIEQTLIEALKKADRPVVLAINKLDLLPDPSRLLPIIDAYSKAYPFRDIVAVSARKRQEFETLLDNIEKYLPEQPAFYPRELYTDQSERFLASETIREVIYRQMSKELPYSAAVEIDDFKSMRDQHKIEIKATIYVERESQKAIFVGKKGAAIKQLGIDARAKLAEVLDANIHLELVVKVRTDWSENPKDLKSFGYMESENT